MATPRTGRQDAGKQRHHKGRLGRILVPHGRISGLLWTVNPRQESKALRELQLYLQPLIADLEREHDGSSDEKKQVGSTTETNVLEKPSPSTSSLLTAELAAYIPGPAIEDKERNSDDDGERPPRKRSRTGSFTGNKSEQRNCRWLAPLETCCKGHLMVSIPFPLQRAGIVSCAEAEGNGDNHCRANPVVIEPHNEDGPNVTSGAEALVAHSVVHNPLVRTVVERIFEDVEENQRPALRHCFRLIPCELTCCPILPEMRLGLEKLRIEHFPASSASDQQLHKVGFSFSVKNNTNVDSKKAYLQAALQTTFPANRFVVIPSGRVKSCGGGVEAMFCVVVVHSTCVMGVQRRFSDRGEFNIHALGVKHLELSTSV
ncbi:uncharacterized protein TEOVI_000259800 [Trypanosoma equiperdum]|nr:hypothetical protein, conserved [Trypanosoma equiperdum]